LPSLQSTAQHLLKKRGLKAEPSGDEYWRFLQLLLRAELERTLRQS
jgi:hypothetical protein